VGAYLGLFRAVLREGSVNLRPSGVDLWNAYLKQVEQRPKSNLKALRNHLRNLLGVS